METSAHTTPGGNEIQRPSNERPVHIDRSSERDGTLLDSRDNYHELSDYARTRFLNEAKLKGDDYKGYPLTKELLIEAKLAPRFIAYIDSAPIYLTDAYVLPGGRPCIMGYISNSHGELVARSYYLSNSQLTWRYLPAYTEDGWYDKGYGEDGLNVPVAAQAAMGSIYSRGIRQPEEAERIFFGTARVLNEDQDMTYYDVVDDRPLLLEGNFYQSLQDTTPSRADFYNEHQRPYFERELAKWSQYSSLHEGYVDFQAFSSVDGLLTYTCARAPSGKAWIAGVENKSPINDVGLRSQWLRGGVLLTPLMEYESQSGGYGSKEAKRGSYVEMWDDFLAHMPPILAYRKYLARRSL